jgi:hypothetical protein
MIDCWLYSESCHIDLYFRCRMQSLLPLDFTLVMAQFQHCQVMYCSGEAFPFPVLRSLLYTRIAVLALMHIMRMQMNCPLVPRQTSVLFRYAFCLLIYKRILYYSLLLQMSVLFDSSNNNDDDVLPLYQHCIIITCKTVILHFITNNVSL